MNHCQPKWSRTTPVAEPHTGTHVIEQKVYGYGDRAFLQVIVTHDAVADNVHDEKIERENS